MSSFAPRRWAGVDGIKFELVPFESTTDGILVGCAKLARRGFEKSQAAMRLEIDDLGVLAMHAHEAFMESLGRVSLELTADALKVGDAIEGLGEIASITPSTKVGEGPEIFRIIEIQGSKTQVVFYANDDDKYVQLIDVTRDKVDV